MGRCGGLGMLWSVYLSRCTCPWRSCESLASETTTYHWQINQHEFPLYKPKYITSGISFSKVLTHLKFWNSCVTRAYKLGSDKGSKFAEDFNLLLHAIHTTLRNKVANLNSTFNDDDRSTRSPQTIPRSPFSPPLRLSSTASSLIAFSTTEKESETRVFIYLMPVNSPGSWKWHRRLRKSGGQASNDIFPSSVVALP